MSSGSGIIVGQSGSGFGGAGLETAFGGGASLPHQGVTTATGHTSELEDPPGLYEKVRIHTVCTHVILHVHVHVHVHRIYMHVHVHVCVHMMGSVHLRMPFLKIVFEVFMTFFCLSTCIRLSIYCLSGFVTSTSLVCSERETRSTQPTLLG